MSSEEPVAKGSDDQKLAANGMDAATPETGHLDDGDEDRQFIPGDTPGLTDWRYAQKMRRGRHRTYYGVVDYARGAQADRLRREQSAAIIALLEWAASRTGDSAGDAGPDLLDREDDAA